VKEGQRRESPGSKSSSYARGSRDGSKGRWRSSSGDRCYPYVSYLVVVGTCHESAMATVEAVVSASAVVDPWWSAMDPTWTRGEM
jgi:hypothetical protein